MSDTAELEDTEILEVSPGSYAIVLHGRTAKGELDAHLLSAHALILSPGGVCIGAMTTLGVQMHVPICGPEGEVTCCEMNGEKSFWPNLETYEKWARENVH